MFRRTVSVIISLVISAALCAGVSAASAAYRIGDADGNGEVNVIDATAVQRIVVSADSDDGSVRERVDIKGDGIDITDATYIQRYCAGLGTGGAGLGRWIYPDPTEKPQDPTQDEYELPFIPSK